MMNILKGLLECSGRFDQLLFVIVNQRLHAAVLDSIMLFLSRPGIWFFGSCGLFALVWIVKGGRKGRITVLLLLVSVAITDPICVRVFKPTIGRVRPNHPDYLVDGARCMDGYNGSFSYPSAHATNMFGVAGVLALMYPSVRWLWLLIAGAVAYSRVYLAQHFPTDVLGGALLGLLVAESLYLATQRVARWKDRKE